MYLRIITINSINWDIIDVKYNFIKKPIWSSFHLIVWINCKNLKIIAQIFLITQLNEGICDGKRLTLNNERSYKKFIFVLIKYSNLYSKITLYRYDKRHILRA